MPFPNQDFSNWILTYPDDKLSKVLRSIEKPLREKNASYKERKQCLQQLTFQCRVVLERIPADIINKYCKRERTEQEKQGEETSSSDFSTKKRIVDKKKLKYLFKKLKYLLQNTSVLKNKSTLCSVWRRRLSGLIRKNVYLVSMIKQRLRSSKVNMNYKEKNEKYQNVECSNIKTNSVAAKLRKRQDDYAKLESALFSDALIKQKCGSLLKIKTYKVNKRDAGQEQVSTKTVCNSIAENGEYANNISNHGLIETIKMPSEESADNKSSHGLKVTIKMPREGVLPNVPEKKVPNAQSHTKPKFIQATPGCKESYNQNCVHVHGETLHSSSQHGCASVCKPQDCTSIESKLDHKIEIKKKTKFEPSKSIKGHKKNNMGNVLHNSTDQKQTESASLDRQSGEKKLLYMIKNRKIVTDVGEKMKCDVHKSIHENITVQPDTKKKLISDEYRRHHEGSSSETNNNCKSKHSSHHCNKKSMSHGQKSASQKIRKSSGCSSRRSQDSNSSHREGKNHKTNSKDTTDQSCTTNILDETHCRSSDREEIQVPSKEKMDYKSSDIVKKRALSNVYKKEVELTSSGNTKKQSHKTSHHTKDIHHSNKTKKAVESLKIPSNNKVKKSFAKESSETTADTVPAANTHYHHYYYCDKNGGPYCCKLSAETSAKILKDAENVFFRLGLAEGDKQKENTTGDQTQLNHGILVSTEPCSIPGGNQALSDTCTPEIPFKGSNNQNKKRPLDPQSQGFWEQNKIQKTNIESAQHQPLLSNSVLDSDVSPGEMSDLNRDCIPHGQVSVEQSATANSVSNHHLLTGTTMSSVDAALDLSQKSSAALASCNGSLCIPKQEKVSDITNKKADVQNTNEITIPTSGTVANSVEMEKQNPVKQEVITECKQEDKTWFRTCTESYSTCPNRSVVKQSEIIIIDDDDDDDCYIYEKTTSCTVSVTKKNKEKTIVEPQITAFHTPVSVSMFDYDKFNYEDSIEAIVQHNELRQFSCEDVLLEGVISVDKCDGNEYILIDKPNFEIPNMEQPITEKEIVPFEINNVMNFFKSSLKQSNCVQIENNKIKVPAKYKIFVACLVFLHVNYHYFFQTISVDVKRLAEILHLHLNARIMWEQMETSALKLQEFKKPATERAEEFIKTNVSTHTLQFSHLFVEVIQKFKNSKQLSPFYQTLFSLTLFQRIIYHLHCIDSETVNKHFFAIRFLVKDLLSYAGSHANVMSLLTEKSISDFVNDFNIVTKSIRIIQSALAGHYCGRISDKNQQHSNIYVYQNEMSSSSLIRVNREENDTQAPAFTQSPSVSSSQLHVNDTVQSPLLPDSSTSGNSSMTNGSFQPYHNISEVTNKSPVSLHPVQGVVLPRTNVTANNQNENQHLNNQKQSTVDYGNYSFPGSQDTLANLNYVPVNKRTLGSQNPAWNNAQPKNNLKQRRHNGSHELGRPPINYSSNQAFRPPVTAHNGLIYLPGNEVVAVGSRNSTWNNYQRRVNESRLPHDASSSSSEAYRPPVDHNGLHYMSDTETVAVDSQNPAWNINTQNVNNLQRRLSNHVTGGPHNEYGLMSNHQRRLSIPNETVSDSISNQHISREYRSDPVAHNGLNSMSEIHNVSNNRNNSMYMNMQPRAEITPDSNFHSAEQQPKSIHLPDTTAPNSFTTTANKNSSLVHSNFLPRSSLSAFHPPNSEYTDVPQGNHSVYSRVQEVANSTNDNYNVHSSGSGTNCQQNSSLEQRVQRTVPTQLAPLVPAPPPPPPLFYQNTTMMMYRRDMLLPQPQNVQK